ncbi:MAG: DUF1566 domain-containing protein [Casimicrobiaceae bacterium]
MAQLLLHKQSIGRAILPGLAAAVLALLGIAAQAAGLNDTGQTLCYSSTGNVVSCAGDQDGRFGRDAAAVAGVLPKTGAGAAGFDYTKIGNNGSVLAAGATLGGNPTDWACTRDNVTGLIWEIKTNLGGAELRNVNYAYTWYSIVANNGGNAGSVGGNTCNNSLAAYGNQCNTTNYVLAVNAVGLCGHSDGWRLPTLKELQSVVNSGAVSPAIDTTYFPNTQSSDYWSVSNFAAQPALAWSVVFDIGKSAASAKSTLSYVRLVRGGQ